MLVDDFTYVVLLSHITNCLTLLTHFGSKLISRLQCGVNHGRKNELSYQTLLHFLWHRCVYLLLLIRKRRHFQVCHLRISCSSLACLNTFCDTCHILSHFRTFTFTFDLFFFDFVGQK